MEEAFNITKRIPWALKNSNCSREMRDERAACLSRSRLELRDEKGVSSARFGVERCECSAVFGVEMRDVSALLGLNN